MLPVFCIKAIKKDIPFDFWKHPRISNNYDKTQHSTIIHFDNLDNSLINDIYQNESILTSNCFLVSNKNEIYVVTCRHSVFECFKYDIIIDKKSYNLTKVFDIPEFDTTILKIDDNHSCSNINFEKYKIIDIDKLDCNISINQIEKLYIRSHNKSINVNFLKTIENDVGNETFTVIPEICLKVKSKITNIFGLSGSPCVDSENKFIGHVFSYDDNNSSINIIPAYCLKYIFNEIMPKSIDRLKTIVIEGSICSIYDDTNNINLNAYKIKKTNSIDYKIYESEKSFVFKEKMLVTKINNLEINKEGNIFFDKINMFISPQSYVLLNNDLEYLKIDGYDMIDGNYSEFTVNIIPEILINYMPFSQYNNKNVVVYKNLVFVELNRDIINLVDDIEKNIKLTEILKNPYSKKLTKQIVLIDILENVSEPNEKLKNFKNNLDKNYFMFLNKINKKNINSFGDLMNEINSTSESNFTFDTSNKKYRNLLY